MAPIEQYSDKEINEFIFRVGDVIQDLLCGEKSWPDNMTTAIYMLQTAHSMMADAHPTLDLPVKEESKQ